MNTYKFKCQNCGSTKFEKVDDEVYRCTYCGNEERVISLFGANSSSVNADYSSRDYAEDDFDKAELPEKSKRCSIQADEDDLGYDYSKDNDSNISYRLMHLKGTLIRTILCFFLGWLGAHRFAEGKIILGIIYFCTLGIIGVGWAVDTIIYIFRLMKEIINYLGGNDYEK